MTSGSCWPSHVHNFYSTFALSVLGLEPVTRSCYCQGARMDEGKVEDVYLALSLQFSREVTRCLCGTGRVGVLRVQTTG